MYEASYYIKKDESKLQCLLCPHHCYLKDGEFGICNVRQNRKGKLYDIGYGKISSMGIDPVEKKPLYHFYPGSSILSIGGLGCNFKCTFCQNYSISQVDSRALDQSDVYSPQAVIDAVRERNLRAGIAFTYNEPLINYDFMVDTARLAKKHDIPTAIVSNGYINPKPLSELIELIEAFNVDLKAFSDDFYKQYTGGKLQPVLKSLQQIYKAGRELEITHLVVTNANDNETEFKAMIDWIVNNLDNDVPLHISRYFPTYRYHDPATQTSLIENFVKIAREKLNYVYPGNINTDASTYCPKCGARVITRSGYSTKTEALSGRKCAKCNYELPIII